MPGTMYTAGDVTINGMSFNRLDDDGNLWVITDLDGWWGLPEPTVPDDPRPFQDDGSYISVGRYEARQITVSGYIIPGARPESTGPHVVSRDWVKIDPEGPDTPDNYHWVTTTTGAPSSPQSKAMSVVRARNALNRAMNLVRTTGLMVVEETQDGGTKVAAVQLVARPLTKFNDAKNVLEFNFQLRAADPRKYAETPQVVRKAVATLSGGRTYDKTFSYTYGEPGSDGLMTVENAGSYNTYGLVTIYGPVDHPAVEHIESGNTLSFNLTLGADEFLEINLKSRSVLLNGQQSRRNKMDPGSEWFMFEPGSSTLRFTGYQNPIPHPAYSAVDNLATNPSFETLFAGGVKAFGPTSAAIAPNEGVYQSATHSTVWAITGVGSLSHSVTASPSTDTFVYPAGTTNNLTRLNMTAGETYTISSYFYQAAEQTGSLHANARSIALTVTAASLPGGTQTYYSDAAPNSEGVSRLSLTVSLPGDTTAVSLRLIHGATNGTVHWDGFMIQTGAELSEEYFDGNSPYGEWSGDIDDSTSSRPFVPAIPGAEAEVTTRSAWIE